MERQLFNYKNENGINTLAATIISFSLEDKKIIMYTKNPSIVSGLDIDDNERVEVFFAEVKNNETNIELEELNNEEIELAKKYVSSLVMVGNGSNFKNEVNEILKNNNFELFDLKTIKEEKEIVIPNEIKSVYQIAYSYIKTLMNVNSLNMVETVEVENNEVEIIEDEQKDVETIDNVEIVVDDEVVNENEITPFDELENSFEKQFEDLLKTNKEEKENILKEKIMGSISTAMSELEKEYQDKLLVMKDAMEKYKSEFSKLFISEYAPEIQSLKEQSEQAVELINNLKEKLAYEAKRADDAEDLNKNLSEQLEQKTLQNEELETALEKEKIANKSHVESIESRDKTISDLEQQINEKTEQNEALTKQNENSQSIINDLNAQINNNQQTYNEKLQTKDNEINGLKNDLISANNAIETQKKQIDGKNDELRQLTDQVKTLNNREQVIKDALSMVNNTNDNIEETKTK